MDGGIEVEGLRKRFGATQALDGMSFVVRPGRVTGFVGPNGAGKSTTMRVVLGLDRPDAGRALVGGQPYRSLAEPLRRLGSLLDAGALQPSRTARNHLLWLAQTQGLPPSRVDHVLGQVGLADAARRRAGGFSLGMRQRLGIAAALLGDPPALMLDEPFNGLDPEGIRWIRALLTSLAAAGRAVLVSSHLMSELEGVADHLVVVGRGRVVADTGVRELLDGVAAGRVTVRTAAPSAAEEVLARAGAEVRSSGPDSLTVTGLTGEAIVARLTGNGVPFAELSSHRVTLEEAYLELTRDAAQFRASLGQEDQETREAGR
ncbi:ATP-binding cassette domain-containing protein [Streptacidiphilus fuscans]|uniref:ATP-binding cassette domain-containing protein n=1 Tax=Streptacidiphilus fuscans TaxID=2789292 RepID=A0A931FF39_9ACTN|nr:ATP-binding cassette domain-containing protein [Streptacidiphilus fuscans]MBF9069381.1 ATP-binding cassette domain-containing protein [Streptacidiphilus fuscans]